MYCSSQSVQSWLKPCTKYILPPINMSITVEECISFYCSRPIFFYLWWVIKTPREPWKTGRTLNFPKPRQKQHIQLHIFAVLFRGRAYLHLRNSLAQAPDIKGNAGAAECLYTRGFYLKGDVKTLAESLWQRRSDCHSFRSDVHPPLFFHGKLEYFYLGILTVLM